MSITATKKSTDSHRLSPERLRTAKAVEVRDGGPLVALENLITDLVKKVSANGGYIALSVEDDVPLALAGNLGLPLQLTPDDEARIFSGEAVYNDDKVCQPFRHNKHIVGYVLIQGLDGTYEDYAHLITAYARLTSKELELADKTAKLQYQNEKVVRKQKQLEQAIAFKNNILSLTTHDIRSPLNAVSGYLEMMEVCLNSDCNEDQLRDYHNQISKGTANISDMIDQLNEIALLELQRIELNLIKVDLNWVVQEVCDLMQGPAINKKQKLSFSRSDKPLYVEIDIPKGKRIIFNLLSNAIKYTRHEGHITVSMNEYKGMANISIKDNGIGIPREKLQTIFEPFQKLNNHGTQGEMSTGLGLFTCSYMTRLFKGSLTVESEPEKGSMFCLHLPLVKVGF